jgi:hypothetical protein
VAYLAASCLLLLPCFWQPRIEAGDLSSHIYNAWLAQSVEKGGMQGLVVAPQATNILFDLLLSGLFRAFGAGAAQRISVSIAVLAFAWGAFAFIGAVSERRRWNMFPCVAILAYGWVFHMGLFNFYLSLGLSFAALALVWKREWNRGRVAAAAVLMVLAVAAHALPVAWAAAVAGYWWLARRTSSARLGYFTAVALVLAAAGIVFARPWFVSIGLATGVDELLIYDDKYYVPLIGLFLIWGLLLVRLVRSSGARNMLAGTPFQTWLFTAAGVLLVPSSLMLPGFRHTLAFIAERMSLAAAVCLCALLGPVRMRALERYALGTVVLMFFGFLFLDARAINAFEALVEKKVAEMPAGRRVINAVSADGARIDPLSHIVDRVCVGRCYSYANYEPSTWQFRVRAVAANPYVAARYADSWLMQVGAYVVKRGDLPLYAIDIDGGGRLVMRELKEGVPCGNTSWKLLPPIFPRS